MRFDTNKIYINWEDYQNMVHHLAKRLMTGLTRHNVHLVGIARGGLVPATSISQLTGFPMTPIHYSTRDNVTRAEFSQELKTILKTETTVVFIDDICDSGQTFIELYDKCYEIRDDANVEFACLFEKTVSEFKPCYSELCVDDRRWIVFPWENK